jgi:hypothetical protein
MSLFHAGEWLRAAQQHVCRVTVLDFPDERLALRRPRPGNPSNDDAIFSIDVDAAAHVTPEDDAVLLRDHLWAKMLYGA